MDKFVVRGGNPLLGTVRISGAKNAALPAMAAALLTDEPVILENIPQVRDIETERKLLAAMGAEVELGYGRAQHRTTICCANLANAEASYELVKTMRASTLVLGPLVARLGHARVSLPGGCAIGARPIDLHLKGLEKLGAKITQEHGYIEARADRLKGNRILFEKITVTGTEDLLMAAVLAEGETVLQNCAREPEVTDLAALLNKMGAQIEGAGTHTIRVRGVEMSALLLDPLWQRRLDSLGKPYPCDDQKKKHQVGLKKLTNRPFVSAQDAGPISVAPCQPEDRNCVSSAHGGIDCPALVHERHVDAEGYDHNYKAEYIPLKPLRQSSHGSFRS